MTQPRRMRIAWFGLSSPGAAAEYAARLLPALTPHADVGIFVEDGASDGGIERSGVHDLSAVHYRNVLFRYDVVVYLLSKAPVGGKMREAFCEWPGVAIVFDDGAHETVGRDPGLRRALRERMLAVIVHSASIAKRLRADDPWISVFELEPPRGGFGELARQIIEVCRKALARSEGWLEALLETACAELPGFTPGDRDAPWRAEVDELSLLASRRQRSR